MVQQQNNADSGRTSGGSNSRSQSLTDRSTAALDQFSTQASAQIESMPILALAGGLALGAIIASVLPQTERELELLEPVGSKITGAGRDTINKVRDDAKSKFDELAGEKVREYFGFGGSSSGNSQ